MGSKEKHFLLKKAYKISCTVTEKIYPDLYTRRGFWKYS